MAAGTLDGILSMVEGAPKSVRRFGRGHMGRFGTRHSNSQGRLQLNDPKIAFEHSQAPLAAHTVFLVDFGGTDSTSPCCGQECVRRGRQPRWEPHEEAELKELRRISEALN